MEVNGLPVSHPDSCKVVALQAEPVSTTLDGFLATIERRAFRMAQLAVRNDDDALDIVQDSMIKLSINYSQRSPDEWKPLFYKILENKILDFHRKETVRKKWFFWKTDKEEDETAIVEPTDESTDPLLHLRQAELSEELLVAIESLPIKQQQCFLLRCWEGLSVKETAQAMNINEGSIKTHYYRAMQKLQSVIREHDDGH